MLFFPKKKLAQENPALPPSDTSLCVSAQPSPWRFHGTGWLFEPSWTIWVRQWEGWHPTYEMENKSHVWNHQPGQISYLFGICRWKKLDTSSAYANPIPWEISNSTHMDSTGCGAKFQLAPKNCTLGRHHTPMKKNNGANTHKFI